MTTDSVEHAVGKWQPLLPGIVPMSHVCGLCLSPFPAGAYVCTGCQASIAYGATAAEKKIAAERGGLLGLLAGGYLGLHAFGGLWHALMAAGVAGVAMALLGIIVTERIHRGKVRQYRASAVPR